MEEIKSINPRTGDTQPKVKIIDDTQGFDGTREYEDMCPTLRAERQGLKVEQQNFRIRKLTPLECFRLQGFTDEMFFKAQAVNSDNQLYKQAGNGVTIPVIYDIGKKLWEVYHDGQENRYTDNR